MVERLRQQSKPNTGYIWSHDSDIATHLNMKDLTICTEQQGVIWTCVCTLPNIAKHIWQNQLFLALQAMSGDQAGSKLNIQLLLIILDTNLADSLMGGKDRYGWWFELPN